MNVETTPELILAAAEKCPQAKEALKTLFPKVFENKKLADCSQYIKPFTGWAIGFNSVKDPCIGIDSSFKYGFYLADTEWNWELKTVNHLLFLIPTRK